MTAPDENEGMILFASLYNKDHRDTAENFIYHYHQQFAAIDLHGKRVLEIGCGKGYLSLLIALLGQPERVDALDEAEGEGGMADDLAVLSANARRLNLTSIRVIKQDIMEFRETGNYDIIVSNNAMHHVCEHGLLRWDVRARKKYIRIFRHLKDLLKPGGCLLMHEYSRYSLWRFVPNPWFREIEWSLHPTRGEWLRTLRTAGYERPAARYCAPYKLRKFGWLARNPIAMFLYYPNFILRSPKSVSE